MTTVFVESPPPVPPEADLEYLHKNALWLIMDPWDPHPWPHDVKADPKINERSHAMVEKIVEYLPNLTHVRLSCPKKFPVNKLLDNIENFYNETPGVPRADQQIITYMEHNNLKDIVYLGFHLGRCILMKESGAIHMSKYRRYRLWMKQDLTGHLITDNYDVMLNESKKWMNII